MTCSPPSRRSPTADPEVHAMCLELARAWTESALECNNLGWSLVRSARAP